MTSNRLYEAIQEAELRYRDQPGARVQRDSQPQQVGDCLSSLEKALSELDEIQHELAGRIASALVQNDSLASSAIPEHPKPPMCPLAQVLDDYLTRVNTMSRFLRYMVDCVQL